MRWICRCVCGTAETFPIPGATMLAGRSRSCGCLRVEAARVLVARKRAPDRLAEARRLRNEGKTLKQIGDALGVTRQRIHTLLQSGNA
ncbi:MAG TPA: sigma factor-like helix-turn-helix DNA-binding protein [Urbifossiella sp.]|nr:sigma factor-like helix-turn-helix DNA-binding protein [Urbifossiella sp.]